MHEGGISIWLFIGLSLVVIGALIFGAGVYQLFSPPPPESRVVLFSLHAPVWWGGILFVIGWVYCIRFWPGRADGSR